MSDYSQSLQPQGRTLILCHNVNKATNMNIEKSYCFWQLICDFLARWVMCCLRLTLQRSPVVGAYWFLLSPCSHSPHLLFGCAGEGTELSSLSLIFFPVFLFSLPPPNFPKANTWLLLCTVESCSWFLA